MSYTLLNVIKNKYPEMSKGHKRISDFILEQYEKAAYMTAARIGLTANVSESTVVRFACELGFNGYPDFQKSLRDLTRKKLTDVQRIDILDYETADSDLSGLIEKTFKNDISSIEETLKELNHFDFDGSVNVICNAKKIYILGVRSASILASFLEYYLRLIFDNVVLVDVSSDSEIYEYLFRITEDDVCIVTSFPRYSKNIISAAEFIRDRGANLIAITDSTDSPLASFSDYLLIAKSAMASVADSLTAPMTLVNALISAVTLRKKDEVRENFTTLENFWEKYGVYESPEDPEDV